MYAYTFIQTAIVVYCTVDTLHLQPFSLVLRLKSALSPEKKIQNPWRPGWIFQKACKVFFLSEGFLVNFLCLTAFYLFFTFILFLPLLFCLCYPIL